MKITHKQKVRMARKMRTRLEGSRHYSDGTLKGMTALFQSNEWNRRSEAKVEKQKRIKEKAELRRQHKETVKSNV